MYTIIKNDWFYEVYNSEKECKTWHFRTIEQAEKEVATLKEIDRKLSFVDLYFDWLQ